VKFISIIFKKIGLDGAIFYTVLARLIQAGGGVITLLFVAKNLTTEEQGYFYTFGSILAVQIFFELGLSTIITQFVAHENAKLIWNKDLTFNGSDTSISRLSSLLRFSMKWFFIISILLFFSLLFFGHSFFTRFGIDIIKVDWESPWILLSISTSLSLLISPMLSFFEGIGNVKEVSKMRLTQQILQLTLSISFFSLGFKLFSAPIASLISIFVVFFWLFSKKNKHILFSIWTKKGNEHIDYLKEIFPFQWKIALSWISGYFIFQLFNPVIFATEGPREAGQMGMTLAVLNGVISLSLSWVNTKITLFSDLIAKKEFTVLDRYFNTTLMQSFFIIFSILLILNLLVFSLQTFNLKLGDRFLPIGLFCLLSLSTLFNHVNSSWATYLRCHKKEPFLITSITIGILVTFSTLFLGKIYGIYGIISGYFILTMVGTFWGHSIFKAKKVQWH
jgi:O-antigen/teichoic acid export membrane protein